MTDDPTKTSAGEALTEAQVAELQSKLGRWVAPYDLMRTTLAWDLLAEVIRERDQLKAQLAALDDGETQQRVVIPGGLIYPPTERDLAMRAAWLPSVRLEQRTIYGTPWVDVASDTDDGSTGGAL